jgi:plasmid stabilization system protein ParE
MKIEWSEAALADLDRFAAFLEQQHPVLARVIARELIEKVEVLSLHPQLGRPIRGRLQYRQFVTRVLNGNLYDSISHRTKPACYTSSNPWSRTALKPLM